jgi:myo-inositol-1(or 4)-monophosphatase
VTSTVQSLLDAAAEAALDAGRMIRDAFGDGPASRTEGRSKGAAHDVVTAVDVAAERRIVRALRAAAPGSAVIGEEGGRDGADTGDGGDGGSGSLVWSVDPIDGTYNFVRGIPFFAVSIGLRSGGRPVAGCVYDPIHDELFTATEGAARLNGQPLVPRAVPSGPPLVLCDIPNAGGPPAPGEAALFGMLLAEAADVRRLGSSALALAYVAAGRAQLAANADVYDWDTAAGRVLATATGCGYRSFPDPLPTDRQGGFVAWAPGHAPLGRRVGEALSRERTEETV